VRRKGEASETGFGWAQQGLNLRLRPCEGRTLPLSYAPETLRGPLISASFRDLQRLSQSNLHFGCSRSKFLGQAGRPGYEAPVFWSF
jgi:hypothetical protein